MASTDDPEPGGITPTPWTDLVAEVVQYHDEPDECTIYPRDAPSSVVLTTWLSARDGAYVDLAEMR